MLTTPHDGAPELRRRPAVPRRARPGPRSCCPAAPCARRIDALAEDVGAGLVLLDPVLPLGLVGRHLARPYGVVLHGAEVTVPARLPWAPPPARPRARRDARLVVAAGGYPAAEAERAAGRPLPTVVVPPGVDVDRFTPARPADARCGPGRRSGCRPTRQLVVSVSRLVPRKGMDVLIEAAARLRGRHPTLVVAIAGAGRDRHRLERLAAEHGAPVRFLGRVPDADLPALYGCADVFAMLCRNRWAGLEQEGFGIVFLEAAAAGVPQIAGDSGGVGRGGAARRHRAGRAQPP